MVNKLLIAFSMVMLILSPGLTLPSERPIINERLDVDRALIKDMSLLISGGIKTLNDIKDFDSPSYVKEHDRSLGFNYKIYHFVKSGEYISVNLVVLVHEGRDIVMFKIKMYSFNKTAWGILAKEFPVLTQKSGKKQNEQVTYTVKNEPACKKMESDYTSAIGELNQVKIPAKIRDEYEFLMNPLNELDYGSSCYAAGTRPDGYLAIEKIMKYGNVKIIENILRSPNPEGRIYAIQALFRKNIDSLKKKNRYSDIIDRILSLGIDIRICAGCNVFFDSIDLEKLYIYIKGNLAF